jgi:hypothetical protein
MVTPRNWLLFAITWFVAKQFDALLARIPYLFNKACTSFGNHTDEKFEHHRFEKYVVCQDKSVLLNNATVRPVQSLALEQLIDWAKETIGQLTNCGITFTNISSVLHLIVRCSLTPPAPHTCYCRIYIHILPATLRRANALPFRLSDQNFVCISHLCSAFHLLGPSHRLPCKWCWVRGSIRAGPQPFVHQRVNSSFGSKCRCTNRIPQLQWPAIIVIRLDGFGELFFIEVLMLGIETFITIYPHKNALAARTKVQTLHHQQTTIL